jgi:hypothetical protein
VIGLPHMYVVLGLAWEGSVVVVVVWKYSETVRL